MLFKKIIKIMVWLCLVFTIVCLFFFINLPNIVESQIEKRLPQFLNPNDIEFKVQKLGFFNTLVSKIRVSKSVSIDSVTIDYDITKLPSIHLKKVTLSGVSIHADLDENNHITIPGLVFPKSSEHQSQKPAVSDLPGISFLPEKIVLQNGKIILHTMDDDFVIPFDVLSTILIKDGKITAQAKLYPFGEKINALVNYDLKKGIEFLKIEGKAFDSGHINQFVSKNTQNIELKGLVDFNLESSSPQKKWKINVSKLSFIQPVETAIKDLSTIVLINNQKISASGTFGIFHSLFFEMPMEYTLNLNLKDSLKNNRHFDLKFKNSTMDSVKIDYKSSVSTIKNPQLNAHFAGTPIKAKGKIMLGFKGGDIAHQKETFSCDKTKITSDIVADFTESGKGLNSKWAITSNNIHIKSDLMTASFPFGGVSGRFLLDKNKNSSASITIKASEGKVSSSRFKTRASGIEIEIPISYPDSTPELSGNYFIPIISYNDQYKFSSKGKIFQTGSKKILISGGVFLKTLPDLKTHFKSILGFEEEIFASLEFKTDPVKVNDADIEKMIGPLSQTADIDLTVSAEGKADYHNHHLKTFMKVKVNNGTISMPDMDFTAAGINTSVVLNDLIVPESVPGQVLTIDSIKINEIKIDDAKIRFSIEDARSLLVENIQFKWCNGLVSTESIRIPQESNKYSLTLYCDRLELTQILKQMGVFNAEGSGTLNGRIPVLYSDGNISFDNGFLFSTPGSGGKIVIENTDSITTGIPMDSPQFAQLDLAQEALKDFDYKWTKLVFNTFEDTLFVNMELDGKPSKLLPFEYQKDLGGFVRVDASSPGSHFQGIKLDVNLKLPFNDVMKFGNKLQSVFN